MLVYMCVLQVDLLQSGLNFIQRVKNPESCLLLAMTQGLTHCMDSPVKVLHGRTHQKIAGNRVSVTQEREQEQPLLESTAKP